MNSNAAPQAGLKARTILVGLAAAAMLLALFVGSSAAAGPIGKDGTIHACYRVKGKPKGAMRVVPVKARCKRGERKVAWSAAGPGGQSGAAGQAAPAGSGQQGQAGSDGSSPNEVALKTQISSLNVKVDGLEKILEGITHGDLIGTLATLDGVTNPELLGAIGSVPLVEEVCGQTEELTGRSDAILGLLDTLDLANLLSIPSALPTFDACPTP
jgi:hypothetical protein